MSVPIPDEFLDLFEKPSLGFLAIPMRNGDTQVTPVWQEWDGTHVNVSSIVGRLKDTLMRRYPRVTLCVLDPDDNHRYLEIRGQVAVVEPDVDEALKNRLVTRYKGADQVRPPIPGEERVAYRILPDKVIPYARRWGGGR